MFAFSTFKIARRFQRSLFTLTSILLLLVSHAASAAVSSNLIGLVDSAAGRYLLGETAAGGEIVRSLLGSAGLVNGDVSPVLAKLAEPAYAGVSQRLEAAMVQLRARAVRANPSLAEAFAAQSGGNRTLSAPETAALSSLASSELKVQASFFPTALTGGYNATRQLMLRALEVDVAQARDLLRYPMGVDPLVRPEAHLSFGFESEYVIDRAGKLLRTYGPASELGVSSANWLAMNDAERVAWVKAHLEALFPRARESGKLVKLVSSDENAFLPETLILDSTGNLEIVLSPAKTLEEWLRRVQYIDTKFGAGSMQGTVGLPADIFHARTGSGGETALEENFGWLNMMADLDSLSKMAEGASKYASNPGLDSMKSFAHPYLGPMTRIKQRRLREFLAGNAEGKLVSPRALRFISYNDASFKYTGGTVYRPDIVKNLVIFESRDAHSNVPILVDRVVRTTFYLQFGRKAFVGASSLRAFDSVKDFEKFSPRAQRLLAELFNVENDPNVDYSADELTSREVFRNFAFPLRSWNAQLELLGRHDLAAQVASEQSEYLRAVESFAAEVEAGGLSRRDASLRIQGAAATFAPRSGLLDAYRGWISRNLSGDSAWRGYMSATVRELGPLSSAFPLSNWEGPLDVRLARLIARWKDNVSVVNDVKFSFTNSTPNAETVRAGRRVVLISTKGLTEAQKQSLLSEYLDAVSRGTVSFPLGQNAGHLYSRLGNKKIDSWHGFRVGTYELPSHGERLEAMVALTPAEELRLRFYVQMAARNFNGVIGGSSYNGNADAVTNGELRDNRPKTGGHNCTSWICTAPIGDRDEQLLTLVGATPAMEIHTNPGWWSYYLTGAGYAERVPAIVYWSEGLTLAELQQRVLPGQPFPAWSFGAH